MKRLINLLLFICFSRAAYGASFTLPERFHPRTLYQRFCERWLASPPAPRAAPMDQAYLFRLGGYDNELINWDITGFYEGEKLMLKPDAPLAEIGRLLKIDAQYNKTGRMIRLKDATLEFSVSEHGIYVWQMGFPILRNPAIVGLVDLIRRAGLSSRFFFNNSNLMEDATLQASTAHLTQREVRQISVEKAIEDEAHDIFLISEISGLSKGASAARKLIQARAFGWVALEGFPHDLQSFFDAYVYSTPDSAEGRRAWEGILKYIEDWKTIYPELEATDENQYLEILKTCRNYGIRVIGIEPTVLRSPFKLKTRNRLWAIGTPISGTGIVYARSKHFEDDRGANYQDFLSYNRLPVFVRF